MTVDEYEFFGVESSGYEEPEEREEEKGVDKICRNIMVLSVMFVACSGLTSACFYIGWWLSFL